MAKYLYYIAGAVSCRQLDMMRQDEIKTVWVASVGTIFRNQMICVNLQKIGGEAIFGMQLESSAEENIKPPLMALNVALQAVDGEIDFDFEEEPLGKFSTRHRAMAYFTVRARTMVFVGP